MKKKRSSFGAVMLKGSVIFNPVLIQLAGICPVAAVSSDLLTSLLFSVVFTLITIVNCMIASALLKNVPRWIRVAIYTVLGLSLSCMILFCAEEIGLLPTPKIYMYLPLLAVNSVTAVHCEQYSVKHSVPDALRDALAVSLGFGGVILLLGALREIPGSGTLAGLALPVSVTLRGMLMPCGSFILLGYMAMILKWYINKYRPEFNEETAVTIKHKPVRLHKEKDDGTPAENTAAYSEESSEMAFLFGSEPEEVEFFTEFWAPTPVTTESIHRDMDELNEKHRQYSADTELRLDDLFRELDAHMADLNGPDTDKGTEEADVPDGDDAARTDSPEADSSAGDDSKKSE